MSFFRLLVVLPVVATAGASSDNVLHVARSFEDGGGYKWQGSGVPSLIRFKGQTILPKGDSTYCSGFTFAVAMKVATQRGLLREKSVDAVRKFQKQWYGATEDSAETQCVLAVEQLGIGIAVDAKDAKPGDFLQLWRTNGSGHSVVFLGWVEKDGCRVGVKHRSSQKSTDGIGDRVEYFRDVPGTDGNVDPKRLYFCRLNAEP